MNDTQSKKTGQTILGVAGIVCIAAGLLLGWYSLNDFRVYERMKDWPVATGTVTASSVVGERAFRPQIVYEYTVKDIVYVDSSFLDMPSFGGRRSRLEAAETMAEEYPAGKTVSVHYDPTSPAISRLRVNPPWSVYGKMGLAGVLLIGGLVIEYLLIRRRRR